MQRDRRGAAAEARCRTRLPSHNRLAGRIVSTSYLGGSAVYEIDIGNGTIVRANTPLDGPILREGEPVEVGFEPTACVLLDEHGLRIGL